MCADSQGLCVGGMFLGIGECRVYKLWIEKLKGIECLFKKPQPLYDQPANQLRVFML